MSVARAPRQRSACVDAALRLAELADDALPPVERLALEDHVAACPACGEQLAALRGALEAVEADLADPADAVDDATRDALLETFRAWHGRRSAP